MSGTERPSGLNSLTVQVKSKKPTVSGEQMLGQNVTIYLELVENKLRFFNGHVTRWSGVHEIVGSIKGQKETEAYLSEATVQPWLCFLTRQTNGRSFQKKTVPDILRDVVGKIGGWPASGSTLREGLLDDGLFNGGRDDLRLAAAVRAVLQDELKHAFEQPRPTRPHWAVVRQVRLAFVGVRRNPAIGQQLPRDVLVRHAGSRQQHHARAHLNACFDALAIGKDLKEPIVVGTQLN